MDEQVNSPKPTESLWRKLYGPSQEEVWRLLSDEVKGTYTSDWVLGKKVEVHHGPWVITLDTYVVNNGQNLMEFTRMRAPFVNRRNFRFTIANSDLWRTLLVKIGMMQDVKIGIDYFDRKYTIETNSEPLVKELLASKAVRDHLEAQAQIVLTVKDNEGFLGAPFPKNVTALHFAVLGLINDQRRLRLLFDLFCRTLERLCDMGVVPPDDPVVRL